MDGNRDDAERCLHLAATAMHGNDIAKATRLLAKSRRMYPLPEQQARFDAVLKLHIASTSSKKSSSSATHERNSRRDQGVEPEGDQEKRQATPEMAAAVRRVQQLSKKNHYDVLGVPRDAEGVTIKRAYRKLALRLHPDRNQAPGADEAFKRVGQAFVVVSDKERRRHYDQFGTDGPEHQPVRSARRRKSRTRGAAAFDDFDNARHEMTPDELFEFLFEAAARGGQGFTAQGFGPEGFFTTTRNDAGGQFREYRRYEGAEDSVCERFKPMLLMVFIITLAMVFAQDAAQQPYSLFRTSYHSREGMTPNQVRYYTASSIDLSRSRARRRMEMAVDVAAWEEYSSRCQKEMGKEDFLLRQSRKWLVGKRTRERYRAEYEAFEKPWCKKAGVLGTALQRQGVY
ncbi:unnamed protein product [Chondrus crispus]|uniref:J domain-containing protein n=1 Tax=Chondrus crispus TaxID=2769 RepID=R7QBW3_CHOCR|nr:unnamed protein product [Chondrus crispus]CDF35288.1 unnamed protein product [Chondrus crispus]|eukprot:XP_005715107.1 unnamed protein product [Chondrus crispus]